MKNLLKTALLSLSLLVPLSVFSSDYPSKEIRLIVPYGAGGGTDALARALADIIQDFDISVVNYTGGAGAVGMSFGAQQRPDGYTLTMVTRELASLPQMGLMRNTADDFELIRLINLDSVVILVPRNSPFNNIHDLIAEAKQKPRSITFASTAAPNFYLMALEKSQHIKLKAIAYNGAAGAVPAVASNKNQVTIVNVAEALSQLQSGELKALGVMSEQRIASIPDVPTLLEQGIEVTSGTWRGIAAPKNTPDEIVNILGNTFDKVMASAKFKSFMNEGAMTIYRLDTQDFTDFVEEDTKKLSELIH